MHIWSMNKWELVEFGDISITKTNNTNEEIRHGYKYRTHREFYTYTVNVYSKNVFIEGVDHFTYGDNASSSAASTNRCVPVASFDSKAEAVALVQDIINAYCSDVKVYSISDGSRYC